MTRREQLGTDEFSLMDEENGRGQGRGSGKKKDDNNNGKETAPKKSKEANKTESEVKESAPKRAKRSKKDEAKGAEESEVKESAPKRAKRSKKDEAKGAEDTAPKKSKEANKTEPEVKESAPKRAKRSKKDEAKGAEDTAPKKSKGADKDDKNEPVGVDEAEPNKSPDKKPADGNKRKSRKGQDKASTWAGRWIPSDPIALSKFQAIQSIFNECIAPKVRSQSSLQSPFFKVCNSAFKALSSTAKDEDYKACAKLQVEKFMADEQVRAWFLKFAIQLFCCYSADAQIMEDK